MRADRLAIVPAVLLKEGGHGLFVRELLHEFAQAGVIFHASIIPLWHSAVQRQMPIIEP